MARHRSSLTRASSGAHDAMCSPPVSRAEDGQPARRRERRGVSQREAAGGWRRQAGGRCDLVVRWRGREGVGGVTFSDHAEAHESDGGVVGVAGRRSRAARGAVEALHPPHTHQHGRDRQTARETHGVSRGAQEGITWLDGERQAGRAVRWTWERDPATRQTGRERECVVPGGAGRRGSRRS